MWGVLLTHSLFPFLQPQGTHSDALKRFLKIHPGSRVPAVSQTYQALYHVASASLACLTRFPTFLPIVWHSILPLAVIASSKKFSLTFPCTSSLALVT